VLSIHFYLTTPVPHHFVPPTRARSRQGGGARRSAMLVLAVVAAAAALLCLSGCANLGYYWQSVTGHMAIVNAARPVQDWLGDATTPDAIKRRLELSQRIRAYASSELGLPDNASYRRYADLQRRAAVWNVVAAPEFSLTLNTWCFAIVGCVSYRGYYSEADAQREAGVKKAEGLEVNVYGVPAYSTLGYLNWAGGDPLLSTFINYPEGELARLIFHELSHQVLYVKDDTMFNESFATAVERMGGAQWLAQHGSEAARAEYAQFDQRRRQFRALTLATRKNLEAIYAPAQQNTARAAMKKVAMQEFKQAYETLKQQWGGYAGYDAWVAQANNASFGALAAYDELVPQFEALFAQQGSWQKFYDACQALAKLPRDERRAALAAQTRTAAQ
jgi:predicted aminopeptidase